MTHKDSGYIPRYSSQEMGSDNTTEPHSNIAHSMPGLNRNGIAYQIQNSAGKDLHNAAASPQEWLKLQDRS